MYIHIYINLSMYIHILYMNFTKQIPCINLDRCPAHTHRHTNQFSYTHKDADTRACINKFP